ncbi:MAG: hypothetical protein ACPGWR_20140 [Ardenticatenaceae bacterium]
MNEKQAWRISIAFSVFLAVVLGVMWYIEHQSHDPNPQQLVDMASAERYLAENQSSTEAPIYVPTGLFIQSVKFHTPDEIQITGYVWQSYQDGLHDGITRGFLLPDAASVTGMSKEAYKHRSGNEEVIGWHIQAILRQKFDYFKYPLDHKTMSIQLLHPDFHRNVLLVPDLDSYDSTKPGQVFGVDDEIMLGEWTLEESFYKYTPSDYDSNFGIDNHLGQKEFPELTFNMVVERKFFNVIIKYLVPLFVVTTLLFAVVMMTNADKSIIGLYDMKALKVLRNCASLFFLVLIGHIHLRQVLANTPVVYLEYFYILAYITIMAVAFNGYLYTAKWSLDSTIAKEKDALLSKLLFWPLLLGASVAITFYAFL